MFHNFAKCFLNFNRINDFKKLIFELFTNNYSLFSIKIIVELFTHFDKLCSLSWEKICFHLDKIRKQIGIII